MPPEPVLTTTFVDSHDFEPGGRRIELYATPGGETTDALVVWMPEKRTVFIGNLWARFRSRAEPVHAAGRQDPKRHHVHPFGGPGARAAPEN